MDRMPTNQNNLQQTKFQVIFPKITSTTYFCQEISLPGIASQPNVRTTPFVELYLPGDKLQYEGFGINFIVDEDMYSWQLIHDWMRGYTFPTDFMEYQRMIELNQYDFKTKTPQYSDAKLQILTALNNIKMEITFINAFPISLSGLKFNSASSADVPVLASAQFKFQYYQIERPSV